MFFKKIIVEMFELMVLDRLKNEFYIFELIFLIFFLVNYGCIFLESLFKNCLFINPLRVQTCSTVIPSSVSNNRSNDDDEKNQAGLLRFNIPDHITIIFSLDYLNCIFLFNQ